jgi:hypothetical protein
MIEFQQKVAGSDYDIHLREQRRRRKTSWGFSTPFARRQWKNRIFNFAMLLIFLGGLECTFFFDWACFVAPLFALMFLTSFRFPFALFGKKKSSPPILSPKSVEPPAADSVTFTIAGGFMRQSATDGTYYSIPRSAVDYWRETPDYFYASAGDSYFTVIAKPSLTPIQTERLRLWLDVK